MFFHPIKPFVFLNSTEPHFVVPIDDVVFKWFPTKTNSINRTNRTKVTPITPRIRTPKFDIFADTRKIYITI